MLPCVGEMSVLIYIWKWEGCVWCEMRLKWSVMNSIEIIVNSNHNKPGVYILPKNLISCHRTIFSSEFKPRISEIKNQSDLPQKWKTLLICATKISNFQKMQEMCKISEKCFYLCMFHHSYCHIDTYFKMTFWFPVVRTARKFELSPHLQDLVN